MYGSLPKEIMAEILLFLADREDFSSLKNLGTVSKKQFRTALLDLAEKIKTEAKAETSQSEMSDLKKNLKKNLQSIFSELPPEEQERLLRGFIS
jgi:hypothetical protein